jgi:hypothetical protein
MTPDEFKQEWQAEPPQPHRFYELAMEYHRRTEIYDRMICRGRRGAVAIPTDGRQLMLIGRNARDCLEMLCHREALNAAERQELKQAIGETGREFERMLPQLLRAGQLDSGTLPAAHSSGSRRPPRI